MGQMRSKKGLLELLLCNIEGFPDCRFCGMCGVIFLMKKKKVINGREAGWLFDEIRDKKPEGLTQEINHPYYWPVFDKRPRIEFLKEIISSLD